MLRFSRLRPTVESPFHIDWNWFERNGIDLHLEKVGQLCHQCRREYDAGAMAEGPLDWVDSNTGEVFQVDPVSEAIMSHCQWKPDYISSNTPMTIGVFRALLANNNRPLNSVELAQRLRRADPEIVLRVLRSGDAHYGITAVV